MTRYVFLNADSIVVQVTSGDLSADFLTVFLRDYSVLFAATSWIRVDDERPVWMGGAYDSVSGEFSPPSPPIIEETVNDDAPIE